MGDSWTVVRRSKRVKDHDRRGKNVTTIFASNFSTGVRVEEIKKVFAKFGEIRDVYVAGKRDSGNRIFAFIRFATSDAVTLEKKMQGTLFKGRKLERNIAKFDRLDNRRDFLTTGSNAPPPIPHRLNPMPPAKKDSRSFAELGLRYRSGGIAVLLLSEKLIVWIIWGNITAFMMGVDTGDKILEEGEIPIDFVEDEAASESKVSNSHADDAMKDVGRNSSTPVGSSDEDSSEQNRSKNSMRESDLRVPPNSQEPNPALNINPDYDADGLLIKRRRIAKSNRNLIPSWKPEFDVDNYASPSIDLNRNLYPPDPPPPQMVPLPPISEKELIAEIGQLIGFKIQKDDEVLEDIMGEIGEQSVSQCI
ncbi:hypothetical protein L1887_17287 [Cichorium endivia]|nr:hypothetical protein L1887_17287 [Cichorium endivia]